MNLKRPCQKADAISKDIFKPSTFPTYLALIIQFSTFT